MYPNLKNIKYCGYALNREIPQKKIPKTFLDYYTKNPINYDVDEDNFLKPLIDYNNQKYILKIFGGSTSFCTEIDQNKSFFEHTFSKISKMKNFYYKNYSMTAHDILHDYSKLKNFALDSYSNSESIFIFNHGWNEEFMNSIYPNAVNNSKPFDIFEANFIYNKNKSLSFLCNIPYLNKLIKKFTDNRFKKLMNFYGIERWSNFVKNNYINYWLKYLEKIFQLINNKKAIIINNPGLANLSDTNKDIDFIIKNSRLNEKYHLYQSICLEINSIFNNNIAKHFNIPIIDMSPMFKEIPAKERIKYFIDEIHFSKKGHKYLSEILEKKILDLDLNKINKVDYMNFSEFKKIIYQEIQFLLDIGSREIFKNYNLSKKICYIPRDRYPSYNFDDY